MKVYQKKKYAKNSNNSFFISQENLSFKNMILERPVLTRYYSLGTFWVRNPQWSVNFDVCFTNTIFIYHNQNFISLEPLE